MNSNFNLINSFNELTVMEKQLLSDIRHIITSIINFKCMDISIIEYYLDILLNMNIRESESVFIELCDYYKGVNFDNAMEYYKIYYEMYDSEKILKKIKDR